MVKVIFIIVAFICFTAAVHIAYEEGYGNGYIDGMRKYEEMRRKEEEWPDIK